MKKKMTPYWIFGGICMGFLFVSTIIFMVTVGITIATSSHPDQEAVRLALSLVLFGLLTGALGIAQIVVAILHLVNYWNNNFENNNSKVAHALYQFFFGLGIIGLIIVLVKQ